MTDRELMQQALNALEQVAEYFNADSTEAKTITALRERLAQPEGCQCPACKIAPHASDCAVHNAPAYPVGACDCGAQPYPENFIDALKFDVTKRDFEARLNLDPTPISGWGRQSIGMGVNQSEPEQKTCLVTDESCKHGSWCSEVYCQEHCKFAQPDPVPYWHSEFLKHNTTSEQPAQQEPVAVIDSTISGNIDWRCVVFPKDGAKLYTAPPQRKPLSDEDIWTLHDGYLNPVDFARAIEAAHGIKGDA